MWRFFDTKILYVPDGSDSFEWTPLVYDDWQFPGDILTVPHHSLTDWYGYDAWVMSFSAEEEISLVRETIKKAQQDPSYRGHIRGISLAESADILRDYYREQWYEDALAKNYTLPVTVQVTASISLRHALWCEKDKRFLETQDSSQKPYGMVSPPLRWSHDLRILQQALRMNIILGIEVFPSDKKYIDTLVEKEILPPFSVGQMIRFRWEKLVRLERK